MTITLDDLIDKLKIDRNQLAHGVRNLKTEENAFHLKELRKLAGVTQVQMALKLGVSQNRISRIERGDLEKAEVGTIMKYVAALNGDIQISVKIGSKVLPLVEFVETKPKPKSKKLAN